MKHTKQIFHAFLFNIRNYSPEELHIILLRVNNFDIKQKRHGIFVLLFICHQHQARYGKIKTIKTQQTLVKAQVFFRKN